LSYAEHYRLYRGGSELGLSTLVDGRYLDSA